MHYVEDEQGLLACLESLDPYRKVLEDAIQQAGRVRIHCIRCKGFHEAVIRPDAGVWRDLRGEFVCASCQLNARERLLIEAVAEAIADADRPLPQRLVFERVTPFYTALHAHCGGFEGVEYGGEALRPGEQFRFRELDVQHQDMRALSFADGSLDLVVHSDVLEHVSDPWQGMREIHRVLSPGGVCVFACPIYTRMENVQRAYVNAEGSLVFTDGPAFHGDPLREQGVPVFYEFGLQLIGELREIGFRCEIGLHHDLLSGYLSNNNPYPVGHMWPLIVRCTKKIASPVEPDGLETLHDGIQYRFFGGTG